MAKRSAQETAAAKAKKQKIILIVGGVLLLAVAAFQGPKLMKHGGSAAAPAPAPPRARRAHPCRPQSRPPRQGLRRRCRRCVAAGRAVKVETSQLASFTLFEVKDPFVRRRRRSRPLTPRHLRPIRPAAGSTGSNASAPPGPTGSAPAGTGRRPHRPPAPTIYATIDFNSKPQQVQVKGTFPTPEPLFVLRSLTKKQAKISVAGGSFDGGQPVTLKLGKKVTLVNTATGVRYVLKLVYTGSQPEAIEGFTTAGEQ